MKITSSGQHLGTLRRRGRGLSPSEKSRPISLLFLAATCVLLIAAAGCSLALKLPTLSSWRSLQGSTSSASPSSGQLQEPLMTSSSFYEPEIQKSRGFAALTRTHGLHHHLPLHLFRSFPKSLLGRFLPSSLSATTPSTTSTTTTATDLPVLFDWSALGSGDGDNGIEQGPPAGALQPMMRPPLAQAPFSDVYHFQATQPNNIQANHFSVDHSRLQPSEPAQKHALGYGDSGEEFATVMEGEPSESQQPQVDSQAIVAAGEQATQQPAQPANATADWHSSSAQDKQQEHQEPKVNESSAIVASQNSSNNSPEDLLQLSSDEPRSQQANSSSSSGNSSSSSASLLTTLIGDELTRLKQEPDELNRTLNSMGQPLLAMLMDQQPQSEGNKSLSMENPPAADAPGATAFVEQQPSVSATSAAESSGPESGRSESAASAVVVGPPSQPAASDVVEEEAASGELGHESFVDSVGGDEQLESFILGPFKGLTSDLHEQQQPRAHSAQQQQQQPVGVGMSAMASNLIQQARSLIQMPFASNNPSTAIRTAASANRHHHPQQQQLLFQRPASYLRAKQDQLIGQANSPAPFSFAPAALTNNNYHWQRQAAFLGAPAWQKQQQQQLRQQQPASFQPGTMMMMPNHAAQRANYNSNNNAPLKPGRPKNPFGFNRYFLMPSSTVTSSPAPLGHLHQIAQAQQPQVSGAKNVPYFIEQPQPQLAFHSPLTHGEQRPQADANGKSQTAAAGFQPDSTSKDNAISGGLEQARKKFKSGLYQIEPPRLSSEPQSSFAEQQQQQKVSIPDDEPQQTRQEEEAESVSAGDDEPDDESVASNSEQLQQASSSVNHQPQAQQQPVEFASKQVGASIDFSAGANASSAAATAATTPGQAITHKGKVFNEPMTNLIAHPTKSSGEKGGQDVSRSKTLKHSEELTLYELESPQSNELPTRQQTHGDEQRLPVPAGRQQQHRQLLDTQVFTVPYTITVQPNSPLAHFDGAPSAHPPAMRPPQNPNFVHHQRETPFAHSFITNTWANPAPAQRNFSPAPRPAMLQQYLAPSGSGIVRQNLFKTIFQEAAAPSVPQVLPRALDWSQMSMRSVPALALLPQQQPQQHYFHYQPLTTTTTTIHQQQQHPNEATFSNEPRQPLAQQFATPAITTDQSGAASGASLFSGSQPAAAIGGKLTPAEQPAAATTSASQVAGQSLGALETTAATESLPTTTAAAPSSTSQTQQRTQQLDEPSTTSPPMREDDEEGDRLASLRGSKQPRNQQQQSNVSGGPSSPSAFCANKPAGLYADESQKCRAYYQCAPTGHQMFRCNNQTQFNQKTQNCDWWYNVNCDGQASTSSAGAGAGADSEQLPRSERLQRPFPEAPASQQQSADDSSSIGELRSISQPEDSRLSQQQPQVAPPAAESTSSAPSQAQTMTPTASSTVAPIDQAVSSAQQQPAPTSSTPIYANEQQSSNGGGGEFSARSTTTQDSLLLLPSAATTTSATITTTTTSAAASTRSAEQDSSAANAIAGDELESQPQVGEQLAEQQQSGGEPTTRLPAPAEAAASSSSSSSISGGARGAPSGGESRAAPSKLSARSIANVRGSGARRAEPDTPIYSTSANQGSISYTPMDTHQLTARAFRQAPGEAGGEESPAQRQQPARRPPIEKRFGARLQQAPASTTAAPISARQA